MMIYHECVHGFPCSFLKVVSSCFIMLHHVSSCFIMFHHVSSSSSSSSSSPSSSSSSSLPPLRCSQSFGSSEIHHPPKLSGSEWWFWEICALLVGFLGTVPLAAHVAANQFIALTFMCPGRSRAIQDIPRLPF